MKNYLVSGGLLSLVESYNNMGLSMRAHFFQNVFELFHVKTSLRELNKKQR